MRSVSFVALSLLLATGACGPSDSGSSNTESDDDDDATTSSDDDDDDDSTSGDDDDDATSGDDDSTSGDDDDDNDDATSGDDDDDDDDDDDATSGDDDDDDATSGDDDDDDSSNSSSDTSDTTTNDDPFSFFVTSLARMRKLSGSEDGYGGNLGGLEGADSICQQIATEVGFGHKTWRAFLSVTSGPDGKAVNAIDRIGQGPWYDRNGRLLSENLQGLLMDRPAGDKQLVEDMTDEDGVKLTEFGDSHDVLTGSNEQGELNDTDPLSTCKDWTSSDPEGTDHKVMAGHGWPANSGQNWITAHPVPGCSPGVNLIQDGPGMGDCVGCGGGWGGIYCFALSP